MSETKFTPGEYHVGFGNGITGPTVPLPTPFVDDAETWEVVSVADEVIDRHGVQSSSVVAVFPMRNGEARANARLFAASKKLYAACAEFVRKVEAGEAKSTRSYAQMKAAIAEADGIPKEFKELS